MALGGAGAGGNLRLCSCQELRFFFFFFLVRRIRHIEEYRPRCPSGPQPTLPPPFRGFLEPTHFSLKQLLGLLGARSGCRLSHTGEGRLSAWCWCRRQEQRVSRG